MNAANLLSLNRLNSLNAAHANSAVVTSTSQVAPQGKIGELPD